MRAPLAALALVLLAPFALAQAPEQVHLGVPTEDPSSELSVLWLEMGPPRLDAKVVLDGPGGPREFGAVRVDGPSAGVAYESRLMGLEPGALYTYKVEGRTFGFSPAGAPGSSFTFVALGDMGITPAARAAVAKVQEIDPAFVLHLGDISYAEGDPVAWKAWFDLVEPVAASRPWITAIGNHEADVRGFGDESADANAPNPVEQAFYRQRFGLPGNELWYSFDWAGVHFVALDTFSELALSQEEVAWLEQDLAAHADAPWTIVFLHEPPYSSNSHGSSPRAQAAFVPLFEEHGVDLVLAAHDHAYERFGQIRDGAPVAGQGPETYAEGGGPLYVVTGGAGESLYSGWRDPPEAGSVARSSTHHVTRLRVSPDALEVDYVGTVEGEEPFADAFRIAKPARSGEAAGAVATSETPGAALVPSLAVAIALALALRRR